MPRTHQTRSQQTQCDWYVETLLVVDVQSLLVIGGKIDAGTSTSSSAQLDFDSDIFPLYSLALLNSDTTSHQSLWEYVVFDTVQPCFQNPNEKCKDAETLVSASGGISNES